jgi:hypothetical protein
LAWGSFRCSPSREGLCPNSAHAYAEAQDRFLETGLSERYGELSVAALIATLRSCVTSPGKSALPAG